MKPFREQNYYELLDLAPDAGADAVAKAYASAKRMFSADALGSYSLFDPVEREALLARIDEAWRTLSDPASRARYDEETLGLVRAPAGAALPQPPKPPAFSYADLAATDVTGAALRARREAIGLPLQEIAVTTRISIAYLQFIEEDHVKGLPHDAYLRGYLTQYARALGLDPHTVADGYLQHLRTLRSKKT
jgi:curved DNA-binding protein CbpA